ncbi:MAG TPA: hypothetical protein VIH17_06105 [Candidatus Acidoferrales bacterium]
MACPICQKRKAKRFCPGKGESICPVCCGTEREVTIDCPGDCPYLVASRRYGEERKTFTAGDLPFPDVAVPEDLVHVQRKFLSGLGYAILLFWKQTKGLTDAEALIALEHMAQTFETLRSGIYYEKLPDAALPRELYRQLAAFIQEYQKNEAERTGSAPLSLTGAPALPEKEIFQVLVFLLRVGRSRTNGRPKSRAFLDFLRAQYPAEADLRKEEPRIIVPGS